MNTKSKLEENSYFTYDAKREKVSKNNKYNQIKNRKNIGNCDDRIILEKGPVSFVPQSISSQTNSNAAEKKDIIEKPPSHGLLHIYLIDADDDRRGHVRQLFSNRSNIVIRIYRTRSAFLSDTDNLDEGCVILCGHDEDHGSNAADFIRQLGSHQRFACVMLAMENDIRTAINAMKAGAIDCLLYPCEPDEILACIYGALQTVKHAVAQNAAVIEARQQIERLTAREKDVLHGLMHGKSNKMIALDLEISPRTVEIYRAHLMEKLGASSLSETLKVAFAAGLG